MLCSPRLFLQALALFDTQAERPTFSDLLMNDGFTDRARARPQTTGTRTRRSMLRLFAESSSAMCTTRFAVEACIHISA